MSSFFEALGDRLVGALEWVWMVIGISSLLLLIVLFLSELAHAAPVDGVSIVMHGAPACYKPNPVPDVSSGTFRPRLPALNGDTFGSTNPWGQWPLARFRGATYGALFGPTLVVYFFPTLQTGFSFVWGTPDSFNVVVLKRNGIPVATINGADVAAAFGFKTGLNLTVTLPAGEKFDQLIIQDNELPGVADEFANLNAVCP